MLLGKKATRIFVASEGMEKFFPAEKLLITGNPVRKAIVQSQISRSEALSFFGLDDSKKTVLVVGGSLGARSINEVIANHLLDFKALDLQLVWQTGKVNAEAYKQRGKASKNVWVNDFIVDMDKAYAAADVVVSRAGAMAVTELCVVKKPVVFVPFPFAAEDHQTVNARYLVDKQAAMMVADSEVQTKLMSALTTLAMDEAQQNRLKENISKLAVTNADEVIAGEVLKVINAG
jgi:UDP-N-acetylglucosamine--N-acetylmuramyl-(pentapeptide) pyrophosphoryl-undecaprenol N-acetylglucosamine transferase